MRTVITVLTGRGSHETEEDSGKLNGFSRFMEQYRDRNVEAVGQRRLLG
jgi:hypothetical protein